MEKENNTDEIAFIENEIPNLNFLKPFEFEPKTNIGDINSSNSDDEEEGADYKVKRISNSEWSECSTKAVVRRCSSNQVNRNLQNTTTLVGASSSKQCKPVKAYTESLYSRERNEIPEQYFHG